VCLVEIKSGEIKNDGEKSEEKMIRISVWLKRENISDEMSLSYTWFNSLELHIFLTKKKKVTSFLNH